MKYQFIFLIFLSACTKINYTIPVYTSNDTATVVVDTTALKLALQGTHYLNVSIVTSPTSDPKNATFFEDNTHLINFTGSTFLTSQAVLPPLFIPGGEGTFKFVSNHSSSLYFTNTRDFPTNAPPGFILDGEWTLKSTNSYFILSKTNSFSITGTEYQSVSTFKIIDF